MLFRLLCKNRCSQGAQMALDLMYYHNNLVPLRSIPPVILMGVIFSTMDMLRRAKLEEIMIREERAEINKELRQSILFCYVQTISTTICDHENSFDSIPLISLHLLTCNNYD